MMRGPRITAALAVLVATMAVAVGTAAPPAGALQQEDTTTLSVHRCYVRDTFEVFLDRPATEAEKTERADLLATIWTKTNLLNWLTAKQEWRTLILTEITTTALGRPPTTTEIADLASSDDINKESPIDPVAGAVYGSTEFFTSVGSDNGEYVDALYDLILHRAPSLVDRNFWIGQVTSKGRVWVATSFYASLESREDRVETLYQRILDRDPEPAGLDYWADRLNDDNDVVVAIAIALSGEFVDGSSDRCSPTVATAYPLTLATPLAATPTDPPFTIDETTLAAALNPATACSTPNAGSGWHPTLLVTPPGVSATTWRSDLSSAGRLTGNYSVCVLTLPSTGADAYDAQDLTRSAQYVVRAVQRIKAAYPAKGKVDIVAHGLGGLSARWAMRWWGSLHGSVDDVVTIGVPNHGSIDAMHDGTSLPTPVSQQSRADSLFMAALNSGADETPGVDVDHTNIASGHDRLSVGVGEWDRRERAWHLSGAANLRVQNQCQTAVVPGADVARNAWVWTAVRDALHNDGVAVVNRFGAGSCAGTGTPDADLGLPATVQPDSEPPLPDYVPVVAEEIGPQTSLPSPLPTTPSTPAYTEPVADRNAAKVCSGTVKATQPTLIVPGGAGGDQTGGTLGQLVSAGLFTAGGTHDVCWLKLPAGATPTGCGTIDHPAYDVYRSSQYVAHVLDQMGSTTTKVDVIGYSRGGVDTAWALQWWGSLADQVDDVVILDSPLRGSGSQRYTPEGVAASPACPVYEQTRADSHLMAALRLDLPRTGPDWTTIGSWDAASVNRTPVDQRQYAWRWPGATNILVQQHCAGSLVVHGPPIFSPYKPHMLDHPFVMAAINDALVNDGTVGTADVGRFVKDATCDDEWRWYPISTLPPPTPPADSYEISPNQEPTLPGYVWNAP